MIVLTNQDADYYAKKYVECYRTSVSEFEGHNWVVQSSNKTAIMKQLWELQSDAIKALHRMVLAFDFSKSPEDLNEKELDSYQSGKIKRLVCSLVAMGAKIV